MRSTEVAYMVNGNCIRIHLGTLQCLVETSGIVEDCDYKSQGSQEENFFLQVYGSNVVFFIFFRWSFGYVLGSHLVIRKRLLETSGICFWRFWGAWIGPKTTQNGNQQAPQLTPKWKNGPRACHLTISGGPGQWRSPVFDTPGNPKRPPKDPKTPPKQLPRDKKTQSK